MTTVETDTEYGVEVVGRGYVTGMLPFTITLTNDPYTGTIDRAGAEALVKRTKGQYTSMGCPEIADTVRLVSRTVTVTRGDWTPIGSTDADSG